MSDIGNCFVPFAVVLTDGTWHECPGITELRALPSKAMMSQSMDYQRLVRQDPAWLDVVREVMRLYSDHMAMPFFCPLSTLSIEIHSHSDVGMPWDILDDLKPADAAADSLLGGLLISP